MGQYMSSGTVSRGQDPPFESAPPREGAPAPTPSGSFFQHAPHREDDAGTFYDAEDPDVGTSQGHAGTGYAGTGYTGGAGYTGSLGDAGDAGDAGDGGYADCANTGKQGAPYTFAAGHREQDDQDENNYTDNRAASQTYGAGAGTEAWGQGGVKGTQGFNSGLIEDSIWNTD
ncbi:hypothetical protein B484DRAFT_408035 [Ochromonadaceae sp. CCMP2298]|nr:hypothetical protein B484DRAFT_408035 [Ochromonadaceae sp. CCMP2298]